MTMFGPKSGTWWLSSKDDPRWDKSGKGDGLLTGGYPEEAEEWVKEGKEKYGIPPKDLTFGFMKD